MLVPGLVSTGEYTTGYVHGQVSAICATVSSLDLPESDPACPSDGIWQASDSDKSAGVVALTMFDLRR